MLRNLLSPVGLLLIIEGAMKKVIIIYIFKKELYSIKAV